MLKQMEIVEGLTEIKLNVFKVCTYFEIIHLQSKQIKQHIEQIYLNKLDAL